MMGDVVVNDTATLEQSYLECERIAKDSSSSFLRVFKTLPKAKRDGIKALYAFCRRADDVADGDCQQIFLHSVLNRWVHFD